MPLATQQRNDAVLALEIGDRAAHALDGENVGGFGDRMSYVQGRCWYVEILRVLAGIHR